MYTTNAACAHILHSSVVEKMDNQSTLLGDNNNNKLSAKYLFVAAFDTRGNPVLIALHIIILSRGGI